MKAKQGQRLQQEQRLRRRIAAHARRLMIEGTFPSVMAFAGRIGLAPSTVHQVLKGERTPGLEFLVALHRALGADANELLDEDPPARWFEPLEYHVTWGQGAPTVRERAEQDRHARRGRGSS